MVQFNEESEQKDSAELRIREQEDLTRLLSEKYGRPYNDLSLVHVNIDALREVPEADARKGRLAPFRITGKILHVATITPEDEETRRVLAVLEGRRFKVTLYVTSKRSLEKAWEYYKDVALSIETTGGILDISQEKIKGYLGNIKTTADVASAIQEALQGKKRYQTTALLELLIASAIATNASDIHIEPKEGEVEIRSSAIPGAYGESVVLRILNPKTIRVGFLDLGIEPYLLGLIEKEIAKPNGTIITTGPTGSGKTTTLYAFLKKLHTPEVKIVTIEDPIEYHLPGVTQTQVDQEGGYTFSEGLRSALRQDPDIIMVGEIRDNDTASTAIHAALTGHMVLSTLHTNDAAGAIPRLTDMGINPKVLGSALNAVLAQRLIRRLCDACKKQEPATDEERHYIETVVATLPERYKKEAAGVDFTSLFHVVGCDVCSSIGYKGRIGVYEAIIMDATIENSVKGGPSARELREVANAQGLLTLVQDGILKVIKGVTTLSELKRVVGE